MIYLAYNPIHRVTYALYDGVLIGLPDNMSHRGQRFLQWLLQEIMPLTPDEKRLAHHRPNHRRLNWSHKVHFSQVRWDAVLQHGIVVDDEVLA